MALSEEKKGTFAVSLTNFLDSGCIVAASTAFTFWAAAFGIGGAHDPSTAFWTALWGAISANAFGAAVGALIGGFLTDRYGRKFIYTYNLLVYALGVFLIMIAVNVPMVTVGIILSGLAVGAGVPASWSYISETSETTHRARNIGISQFAWSCGPTIIFILSLILSMVFPATDAAGNLLPAGTYGPFDGLLGTRIIFAMLFVVALIAWNLQRKLHESDDWVEKRKETEAEHVSFGKLMGRVFTNSINVKTIIFLVAVYVMWNLVAGTQGGFMPYLYTAAGGLTAVQSNILNTVMWALTAIFSLVVFSKFGDRVSHRVMFGVGAAMALAAWILMVFFGTTLQNGTSGDYGWILWVYVALWGISAGFSAQCFYALWGTELFPTQYRGGAQGIMFFLVRGLSGIWSLVAVAGLSIGTPSGFTTAGILMCIFLAISLLVGVIWCPKTQGKTLDQITKERYGDNI